MNEELFEQLAEFAKTAYQYDGEITPDTTFDELGKGSMKMIALTSTFGELVERVAEEIEE